MAENECEKCGAPMVSGMVFCAYCKTAKARTWVPPIPSIGGAGEDDGPSGFLPFECVIPIAASMHATARMCAVAQTYITIKKLRLYASDVTDSSCAMRGLVVTGFHVGCKSQFSGFGAYPMEAITGVRILAEVDPGMVVTVDIERASCSRNASIISGGMETSERVSEARQMELRLAARARARARARRISFDDYFNTEE